MLKRIIDISICLVLSPVLAILSLFIGLGIVKIFTQQRVGKNGKLFKLFKLKTMNDRKDEKGKLLPDAQRLTSLGKWLRKMSIDELPQLYNILRGDMSLIGPRPLLPSYLPLYNDFQNRRHEVLPGITGWAQVKGRNSISWSKRFELDVFYVDHQSFLLDMKIIVLTIINVFLRKGISGEGSVTMKPFTGNYD
jgi:undecaprenyl phosphate N,N'-diacetylbacillosamine 1-phosphate transferase